MGDRDKLGVVDEGQSTENKVQGQTCQGRGRRMSRERSGRTRGFPRDEMPRRTEGQVHTQRSPGHSTLSVTGRWLLPSQHWAEVKCKLPSALPLPLLPNHPEAPRSWEGEAGRRSLVPDFSATQCAIGNYQRCSQTFMHLYVPHSTIYRGKDSKCSTRELVKYIRISAKIYPFKEFLII